MLKHVGKHNDRKVALVFREVPGEEHMCLLVYSDLLPRIVHDEIMKTIESPAGQAAENLGDALFRTTMTDGRNCLEAVHREGFMADLDAGQGYTGKRRQPDTREVGVPRDSRSKPAQVPLTETAGVLTDELLAQQRIEQAEKMKASAQQLLAEAERLMSEATEFNPTLKTKTTNAKKKPVKAHQH